MISFPYEMVKVLEKKDYLKLCLKQLELFIQKPRVIPRSVFQNAFIGEKENFCK